MTTITARPNVGTQKSSTALENTFVIAQKTATLLSLLVTNIGEDDRWLLIFDAAAAPEEGALPLQPFFVPAGSTAALDTPIVGVTGIVAALSTTPGEYTAAGGAVGWITSRHI